MLTIFGQPHRKGGYCDGVSRRDFLTIGGTLVGGALSLPTLLAAQGRSNSHKAIINVFLPGGPPHQDMWDLKPDAPEGIRGEFSPIKTNVSGIDICEHFPNIAKMADKFAFIRSIVGSAGDHASYQCMTGKKRTPQTMGYWPAMGAYVSKLLGPADKSVPPHVSLMYRTGEQNWGYPGDGGYLGLAHAPFRVTPGIEAKGTGNGPADNMVLKNLTLNQLNDRLALTQTFDGLNRAIDNSGVVDGMNTFTQQAMGILTSSRLVDALDLSKEDPKNLARYGENDTAYVRDGAPRMVRTFCVARRLVEAGARVVTMNFSRWDWHGPDGKNFVEGRKDMPLLDRGVSALISDLDERGLLNDVAVVVWGEFGRTPRINKEAGRDHWPQVSCALMAGGGMKTGQVIGATNRLGEYAIARPTTHQEVFATLYSCLGINLSEAKVIDPSGRPQFLVEDGVDPIRELI